MRVRSYGVQPPMRAPKARSYGTCPSLHERAGTFASFIIKPKKLQPRKMKCSGERNFVLYRQFIVVTVFWQHIKKL